MIMENKLKMVIEICHELSQKKNDTFSIPVSVNGRLTKTLGRVIGTKNNYTGECIVEKMEISKKLLEHGTYEDIRRVVAHEWTHYYLMKTTKKDHGHDAMFNALSMEMGGNPGTSTVIEGYRDVKTKYEVFCTCCGKRVGQYSRAGAVVKTPENYKANCCGAALRVEQNW